MDVKVTLMSKKTLPQMQTWISMNRSGHQYKYYYMVFIRFIYIYIYIYYQLLVDCRIRMWNFFTQGIF